MVAVSVDEQGREWYEHADGSRSTSFYVWRRDLGRYDATSTVSQPHGEDGTGKLP